MANTDGAPVDRATLLLHPVRLRVVQALLGDRHLTTSQLREALPDVPAATLYRHVGTLARAGVLVVEDERRVRGAVERTYRLDVAQADVGPDEAARMTAEDHRHAFTAFAAGLLGDVDRYLDGAAASGTGRPDLAADRVTYRQVALHLDDAETDALLADLRAVLRARLGHEPRPGRRRRLLTTILLPTEH